MNLEKCVKTLSGTTKRRAKIGRGEEEKVGGVR